MKKMLQDTTWVSLYGCLTTVFSPRLVFNKSYAYRSRYIGYYCSPIGGKLC